MAFKRTATPTFKIEITVMVANDKGGFDKNTFFGVFKRASIEQQRELRAEVVSNEDLVRRQMVDWELRDGDTKELVPFSAEALDELLSISPTPMAAAVAFWEGCNGARAKN